MNVWLCYFIYWNGPLSGIVIHNGEKLYAEANMGEGNNIISYSLFRLSHDMKIKSEMYMALMRAMNASFMFNKIDTNYITYDEGQKYKPIIDFPIKLSDYGEYVTDIDEDSLIHFGE